MLSQVVTLRAFYNDIHKIGVCHKATQGLQMFVHVETITEHKFLSCAQ